MFASTACGHRMAHRKGKETKLLPSTAGPGNMLGCCLNSFHFLWANLCPQALQLVISVQALALMLCHSPLGVCHELRDTST